MTMPDLDRKFSSLEEAWIDLMNDLDPEYMELLGQDLREFFFAGAVAALALMMTGRLSELKRDLDQNVQKLKEAGL